MSRSPSRRCLVRLLALFISLGALAAAPAFAHAVLVQSSLGSEPIPAGAPLTVTFRFNAALEQKFFRATLIGPGKEQRELETMPGKDRTEERIELPPLEPGKYGIAYKILAADSHLTEGVLRFTVVERK